jgi:comEA protein
MNNKTENNTKYDSEAKDAKIFLVLAVVFLVSCVVISFVFDYIDRTQYVEITRVPTAYDSIVIPENEKVNINTATKEELMTLSGIGSVMADNIIRYREENNGFLSIDELKEVSGIGKKTFQKLRPYITA